MAVNELIAKLGADISAFEKGMSRAGSKLSEFDKKVNKIGKVGKKFKSVGKSLTIGVSAPLAALGALSVKTFSDFDDQMRRVGATAGATGDELDQLRNTAKKLGRTTAFTAKQAAEGLNFMALAGFDTKESIEAIPNALNLASAASLDLGRAADILTDNMSAFGIEASESARVADVLAKAQASANTTVDQLGEAFQFSSAAANSFGASIETTSALLGKFADNGIKGSRAGTVFNAILRDLKKSADNGIVSINGQNIALADQEGNFRNIIDIMSDVESATKGLTQQGKDQALSAAFQTEAMRGVNILMSEGVDAAKDLESQLYDSAGASDKLAKSAEKGLGGSLRKLKSALEGASIEIGEVLAPYVQKLTGYISKLAGYFSNLSPTAKKLAVAIGAVAAAIGPLAVVIGTVLTAIPSLVAGFTTLKIALATLSGPIGLAIAGLSAVAAAITIYNQKTRETQQVVRGMDRVRQMANKSIDEERIKVNELFKVAKSEFASKQDRINAIEELNRISPKYLGNLDIENIRTQKASDAVKEYNEQLIKNAKVKAAQERIQEISGKILDVQRKLIRSRKEYEARRGNVDAFGGSLKRLWAAQKELGIEEESRQVAELRFKRAKSTLAIHENIVSNLESERDEIASLIDAQDILNSKREEGAKIGAGSGSDSGDGGSVFGQGLESAGFNLGGVIEADNERLALGLERQSQLMTGAELKQKLANERWKALSEDFNNSVLSNAAGAISSTFENIGSAIATGGNIMQALGQSLLSAFSGFLGEIGDMLIKYGTLAIAKGNIDLAIAAGGPGAILAGAAAIAIGAALKAASGAMGSKAKGGFSGGGGGGGSYDPSGGGSVQPRTTSQQGGMTSGKVVFEIEGQKLVGVLSKTLNKNKKLGGSSVL